MLASTGEEVPLLRRRKSTPLPKFQLFILLWVQLAEPIASQVIYPFINKLVSELPITGGDESKVGYYGGLIESLFFVAEALTVLQWSRWSDTIGRRPILLTGLFGLALSMVSFGLSKSFWSLVVSRCLAGLLNGNVGVIKSMMGELTDSSNIAQGMALMPVAWSTGATVGPIIGGMLSNPYERFPSTFGKFEFWKTYPYALPCFVVAINCGFSFILTYLFLEETVKYPISSSAPPQQAQHSDEIFQGELIDQTLEMSAQLTIRDVLTPRVVTAIANYSLLAFLDIALRALQPLFYTMQILNGGLGFLPPLVGICLGAFGLFSGLYQAFIFSPVYNRFGTKRIFVTSVLTFIPMFALFPLMNLSARHDGVNAMTWVGLTLQMILYIIMDMGFSCAFIYIRTAAPNKNSLGATNGLAQTSISIVRAIGPAVSNSLFAVSVERDLLHGRLVYLILMVVSALALVATTYLPTKLWEADEE